MADSTNLRDVQAALDRAAAKGVTGSTEERAGQFEQQAKSVENLADLTPPEWRSGDYEYARFTFFPSGLQPNSSSVQALWSILSLARVVACHPVSLNLIQVEVGTRFKAATIQVTYIDGAKRILSEFGDKAIAPGMYLLLFSPIPKLPNDQFDYSKADDAVRVTQGLVVATFGHAAAETAVYSCDAHLQELKTTLRTEVIENFPPVSDYRFIDTPDLARLARNLATHLPEQLRERAQTAFLLIGESAGKIDQGIRLAHDWIALEVLCGSRGKAEESVKAATRGDTIAFARIKSARDNFFHNGRREALSIDDERTIHAALFNALLSYYNMPPVTVVSEPVADPRV